MFSFDSTSKIASACSIGCIFQSLLHLLSSAGIVYWFQILLPIFLHESRGFLIRGHVQLGHIEAHSREASVVLSDATSFPR